MKLIDMKGCAQPDPYIIKANGKYYVYATSLEGVELYRADDPFGKWEKLPDCLALDDKYEYWAPSVIEIDGTFYMYVSFMDKSTDDVHQQTMHVLTSSSPEGPFTNPKKIIEPFSIDSHVVKTDAGLFIFYSVNDYEAERAGTYIVVDRMLDPFTPEGKPVSVIRPTLDEEIFQRDRFRKGQHWHTLEGAFYFREGNRHFITYSGNCYQNEYYYVGYAYAETEESDLTKIKFTKYPDENTYCPLLKKNAEEEGTGHNSILDYDGEKYIVYHGRDYDDQANYDDACVDENEHTVKRDNPDAECRTARIRKLKIDGIKIIAE